MTKTSTNCASTPSASWPPTAWKRPTAAIPACPWAWPTRPTCCGPSFSSTTPPNPTWPDRDRFILSAGHGSMLLYSLLHLTGYDLPLDELKRFRQWESKTPGHPEYGCAPGVETTTGPLGQGFATGVGMALATRLLATRYNQPGHTDRRPPHLCHRQRRRPDGGHLLRGRLPGRAPGPGRDHLPLRRQPHLDRRQHRR